MALCTPAEHSVTGALKTLNARFHTVWILVLISLVSASQPFVTPQLQSRSRPNVIMLSFDDLNDWVSILPTRHPNISTPNLERLAKAGIVFTNAHAAGVLCSPSRTAVMTGLYPSTTGYYRNKQPPVRETLPSLVQLPEQFRNDGYYTYGIAKVSHDRGEDQNSWNSYKHAHGISIGQDQLNTWQLHRNKLIKWGYCTSCDEYGKGYNSVKWAGEQLLKEMPPEPFFLAIGLEDSHYPWISPETFWPGGSAKFASQVSLPKVKENDRDDIPKSAKLPKASVQDEVIEKGCWQEIVAAYLGLVSYSDHLLGQFLDAFYESKYVDNTIIILWADHGLHLGEKQAWGKMTLYERTSHVPLMIVLPPWMRAMYNIPAGIRIHDVVSLVDIYPTLMELCWLKTSENSPKFDGVSLVPFFSSDSGLRLASHQEHIALTFAITPNNTALRTNRWRYIRYSDFSEELYDMEADPHEWENKAADPAYSHIKEELSKYIPAHPHQMVPFKGKWKDKNKAVLKERSVALKAGLRDQERKRSELLLQSYQLSSLSSNLAAISVFICLPVVILLSLLGRSMFCNLFRSCV